MRKLTIATVAALVAATAFAPAAQAKRRRMSAAPAPMMMAPMGNPRINAQGEFYATPVGAGDPTAALLTPLAAPLAIPGAVVGGVAQPVVGGGLDILSAPLK